MINCRINLDQQPVFAQQRNIKRCQRQRFTRVQNVSNNSGLQQQENLDNTLELSARMKKGEFTKTGVNVQKITKPLRQLFTLLPFDIGRPIALQIANWVWEQQASAAKRMPVARGDPRIVAGQPFIVPLFELYKVYGPVFCLSFGVKSIIIVSDPAVARQILVTNAANYSKGLLSDILEFVMGTGLIPANGEVWKTRRRMVVPSLHRKFLQAMITMFSETSYLAVQRLEQQVFNKTGQSVEMESFFSRFTLDIIGKAVFNYDFDSLTKDDPVIKAVYTVLSEAEHRSLCPFPYWNITPLTWIVKRQRETKAALKIVNDTLDQLVAKCKQLVDSEDVEFEEEFVGKQDPSILHFLIAGGDDINSKQLRDDLMTLLIAGHETTAAVLTWTFYLLNDRQDIVQRIREEVDNVLGDDLKIGMEQLQQLKFTSRVIFEAMRLYPQPPLLIRRALKDDVMGNYMVPEGSDVFISTWNLHRSENLWEQPLKFDPDRWPVDEPTPDEYTTDFKYLPFGGGQRKCIGDRFALYESLIAVAVLLKEFDFTIPQDAPAIGIATGATIHTSNGLYMNVSKRVMSQTKKAQNNLMLTSQGS